MTSGIALARALALAACLLLLSPAMGCGGKGGTTMNQKTQALDDRPYLLETAQRMLESSYPKAC